MPFSLAKSYNYSILFLQLSPVEKTLNWFYIRDILYPLYIYPFVNAEFQTPNPNSCRFFSEAAAPAGSMLRSLWHHALPRLRPATTQTDTIRSGQGWGVNGGWME